MVQRSCSIVLYACICYNSAYASVESQQANTHTHSHTLPVYVRRHCLLFQADQYASDSDIQVLAKQAFCWRKPINFKVHFDYYKWCHPTMPAGRRAMNTLIHHVCVLPRLPINEKNCLSRSDVTVNKSIWSQCIGTVISLTLCCFL